MDLLQNLGLGFATAASPENLLFCLVGVILGTLIGVLPGIGATATIAMLLPITFQLEPVSSLIMLAGIYYGAQYGGSTTAILINMPGESSSAVTAIDGYQMARRGKAGTALAVAALGSFFAGTVATLLVALLAPPLTAVALEFGSAEYTSLMVLGLVCAVALAHGSFLKALAMVVLGLLLGLVGSDVETGVTRFTGGVPELADGLSFVGLAVGLFGIAEVLRNLEGGDGDRTVLGAALGRLWPSRADLRAMGAPMVRGTALGSALGVLPGGGAILAAFGSYTVEKRLSKNPREFGQGAVAGVAGPESANNAAAQTSFIPLLTLGIPANPVMALMVGAMIIQGIVPGPNVATEQPELFWGIIASMWIGNLLLIVLNLPLIGLWVRLLRVPYHVLFPVIVAFSSIGVYSVGSAFDLFTVAFFGLLGYLFLKLRCEPAPLLLGFVLGPLLEENLRRAMILGRGDPTVFLTRPISAGLLLLTLAVVAVMLLPRVRRKREEVFVADE